jgi:hypothetical protein
LTDGAHYSSRTPSAIDAAMQAPAIEAIAATA